VRGKLANLEVQSQDQKRRLEQLQSELDKRPYIDPTQQALYYHLKLEIERPAGVSGIRASIYKIAGETGAYQHLQVPIFQMQDDHKSMVMNLYFSSPANANDFMTHIHHWGFYMQWNEVQVTCPRNYTPTVVPYAHMQRIYREDYNTRENPLSPTYTLYDTQLERVDLDDIKQLQMFEKPPGNVEIGTYGCHIASKKRHPELERNENNKVHASWLFHQYFDGLVTQNIVSLVLVRPEWVYEATTFLIGGQEHIRYRMVVRMDFTSEAGLHQLLPFLHDGTEVRNPKRLRTSMHTSDPEETCGHFRLKYDETIELWKAKGVVGHELPFLDVEYNRKYPRSE
jgi:hypothetical protein